MQSIFRYLEDCYLQKKKKNFQSPFQQFDLFFILFKLLIQIAGAIIVSLVWLTLGTMIGFATIAIPQLRRNNRTILSYEETEIGSPIIARINVSEINEEGHYLDAESESWFAAANLLAGNINLEQLRLVKTCLHFTLTYIYLFTYRYSLHTSGWIARWHSWKKKNHFILPTIWTN